ncbi:MAG: U32 family peptidase [Magnetococcales bacterium]|nr:U32 family peptidase [Magnetococcales bacterium]
MSEKMELLAPAGNWQALEGVIEAGADAVYVAEKRFAMRQHGAWLNFSADDLTRVVAYAHEHGVRCYLALNNLLTDAEITLLTERIPDLIAMNPDALIVQDLGVIRLLHEMAPGLSLHASTMMSVHHPFAAQLLKELAVTRIIASRDITLHEAARIGRESGLEVEYFVHGDMCVAQGSQCYHSGIAAGMSANRGKCLKSCRWAWSLIDRRDGRVLGEVADRHLLARNDLCLYHQIPELAVSGIHCLKIEGRARPAEYLIPIVASYRQAIDRYYEDPVAYRTDFAQLNRLKHHTLREVNTGHAFHRPGPGSSGITGKREPRFFSLVVQERPWEGADEEEIPGGSLSGLPSGTRPELVVRCGSPEGAEALLDAPCDWITIGGEQFVAGGRKRWGGTWMREWMTAARGKGKKVGIHAPRITTEREFAELERLVADLGDHPPDEYRIANLGTLAFFHDRSPAPLHADYGVNVWNTGAVALLRRLRVSSWTPGLELPLAGILDLAKRTTLPLEVIVHGALPGMLLEYCPIGVHLTATSRSDPCSGPCVGGAYALRDRAGGVYWLEADQYCRNHLFMARDLCALDRIGSLVAAGVARIRIEGALYTPEILSSLVTCYRQALDRVAAGLPLGPWSRERMARLDLPRPLTRGVFGHTIEAVSQPLAELPTNLVILHDVTLERKPA